MKFIERHSPSFVGIGGLIGLLLCIYGANHGRTALCTAGAVAYAACGAVLLGMFAWRVKQIVVGRING